MNMEGKSYKSCKSFLFISIMILCLLHYLLYYFGIMNWEGLIYGSPVFSLYLINRYFGKISLCCDVIKIEYLFTTPLFQNEIRELVKIDELRSIEINKILGFEIIYLKYRTGKSCLLTPKCQSSNFLKNVNKTLLQQKL